MANTSSCTPQTQSTVALLDKENMKTGLKLGYSPFSKTKNSGSKHKTFTILTDDEAALLGGKNSPSCESENNYNGQKTKKSKARRSLATLQPSTEGTLLAGQGREEDSVKKVFFAKKKGSIRKQLQNKSSKSDKQVISTFSDENNTLSNKIVGKDTDDQLIQDALSLMKQTDNDNINEDYWKNISEERRLALEETLAENENLCAELDKLEEENKSLKKALSDAECFKILYNNLMLELKEKEDTEVV